MVSDSGPSPKHSVVWVTVRVLDENDNKPVFPEKVYQVKLPERERRKKAEPVYRVFAYDRDEGPNGDLSYGIVDGNEDAKFFIDPKTAVLSSKKAFAAGSYNILTVRDLGPLNLLSRLTLILVPSGPLAGILWLLVRRKTTTFEAIRSS